TKEDSLYYSESAMNHAMCITGVTFDENGKPAKWKIENSWGGETGNKGYFLASAEWFDTYVFQAVVNKKYLPDEILKCLDKEPHELNPWDPMGTLAD
ncbi:MAG: aminopeptidase, partial [Oscillospiraceae bacterium]|nr:aminopeptidase [Oscillospiraceae bacterium]